MCGGWPWDTVVSWFQLLQRAGSFYAELSSDGAKFGGSGRFEGRDRWFPGRAAWTGLHDDRIIWFIPFESAPRHDDSAFTRR